MKTLKNISLLLFVSLVLFSCQDVVEVDLEQGIKRIVVEGNITDIPNYRDTVKLSYNTGFYEKTGPDYIIGATVTISDDQGGVDTLSEVSPGMYITSETYRGIPGNTYTLNVITPEGTNYYSDGEYMEQVPVMDSFYIKESHVYNQEVGFPPVFWGDNVWQVHIDFVDNESPNSVYGWNIWLNGEFMTDEGESFYVREDFFGQQNGEEWINLVNFSYEFEEDDSVYVEQYTMSLAEFEYKNTLSNSESENAFEAFFGTTPAPVESNIHNRSDEYEFQIGFFGAHSVVSNSVILPAPPESPEE